VLTEDKTLGGYYWLYRDVSIRQQIDDVIEFMQDLQVSVPVLWPDIEPYKTNDNLPSITQIKEAIHIEFEYQQQPGIYTGPWVWSLLRNVVDPELYALPLWTAEYNKKATLYDVTLYGGWGTNKVAGHQYTSEGVDQSIFDKRYTVV
jgi:GH25 family lysozyme M1 (1,4-beta-N-acetylmuramidase)